MRHPNAKYSFNERYFQVIDTAAKAYWLGFIASDGCVYRNQLSIKLRLDDAEHLRLFVVCLEGDIPVYKRHPSAVLRVCSKELVSDLQSHGITPAKSLTAKVWSGPSHLMSDYWRGVVDGDGWITQSGRTHVVGLCGSQEMVESFARWGNLNLATTVTPYPQGKIYACGFGGTFVAQGMAKLLYNACGVALERKKQRADNLISRAFKVSKFAPRTDVSNEQLIDAYAKLRSTKKVGKLFSMDAKCVGVRLKKLGIKLRQNRWDESFGLQVIQVSSEEQIKN